MLGRGEEALDRLAHLKAIAPSADDTYLCSATVYDALGNPAEVFSSLRGGLKLGATVHSIKQLPLSKQLRVEDRYQDLLDEFGFKRSATGAARNGETIAACPQSTVAGLPLSEHKAIID